MTDSNLHPVFQEILDNQLGIHSVSGSSSDEPESCPKEYDDECDGCDYENAAMMHTTSGRSEQLESGLTCMMCRKPKENDGHTCCEECAGLAF